MGKFGFVLKVIMLVAVLAAVVAVIATVHGRSGERAGADSQGHRFFEQFVVSGGPVVWFVLLPMSVVMVYLVADYGFRIRRARLLPEGKGADLSELVELVGAERVASEIAQSEDLVSVAVAKALNQGGDWFKMRSVIAESLAEQAGVLMRRIEWVNLIGNVSPMVGLFGTVYGMIKLFNAIVLAGGQPQPAQLADGISVALVTTFWGLFIAIPAVAVYGIFQNRIETLVSEAVTEVEGVMPQIRTALKRHSQRRCEQKQKVPIEQLGNKSGRSIRQASTSAQH